VTKEEEEDNAEKHPGRGSRRSAPPSMIRPKNRRYRERRAYLPIREIKRGKTGGTPDPKKKRGKAGKKRKRKTSLLKWEKGGGGKIGKERVFIEKTL